MYTRAPHSSPLGSRPEGGNLLYTLHCRSSHVHAADPASTCQQAGKCGRHKESTLQLAPTPWHLGLTQGRQASNSAAAWPVPPDPHNSMPLHSHAHNETAAQMEQEQAVHMPCCTPPPRQPYVLAQPSHQCLSPAVPSLSAATASAACCRAAGPSAPTAGSSSLAAASAGPGCQTASGGQPRSPGGRR
jgi:hypothetical protein